MMPDEGSGASRSAEVEALVRRLEPRIIDLFSRHRISPTRAGVILEEVVTLMLYRWGQVTQPETWVMELLEVQVKRSRKRQSAAPEDADPEGPGSRGDAEKDGATEP